MFEQPAEGLGGGFDVFAVGELGVVGLEVVAEAGHELGFGAGELQLDVARLVAGRIGDQVGRDEFAKAVAGGGDWGLGAGRWLAIVGLGGAFDGGRSTCVVLRFIFSSTIGFERAVFGAEASDRGALGLL